jgi:hypothetical protein
MLDLLAQAPGVSGLFALKLADAQLLQHLRREFADMLASEASDLDPIPAVQIAETDLPFRPEDILLSTHS